MSGGSLEYVYYKVTEAADSIRDRREPLYQAFAKHLDLVSRALHDVEWVLSGDYGAGDDVEAVRKVLAPGAELAAAIESSERTLDILKSTIKAAKDITQQG